MIDFKWLSDLPSQQEIMEQWDDSYEGLPQVSIACITYNQEIYIKDALNGFLQQKTKFPFEIIVHDDASTDSTVEILEAYRDKYPKVIKLILQAENQFSKSMYLPLKYCFDLVSSSSKYIALCEGDDFWIAADKIQNQYEALEEKQDIDICFTDAYRLFNNSKVEQGRNYSTEPNIFTLSETVRGGGGFMPTASIFIRKRVVNKIPDWILTASVVDYYLQVLAAAPNGALYIPYKSCVYRVSAKGSWTESRRKISKKEIIRNYENDLYCLKQLGNLGVEKNDINRVVAEHISSTAFLFLINGFYVESRKFIKESWRGWPRLSKMQKINYYNRYNLFFLRAVLVIRMVFRNKYF